MKPITKTKFGPKGVLVRYYNGTATANGYVVQQTGTNLFKVTDGTNLKTCRLAQTPAELAALGSAQPTLFTIPITTSAGTEHARSLFGTTAVTVEGHRYTWNLTTSLNGSAVVAKYS